MADGVGPFLFLPALMTKTGTSYFSLHMIFDVSALKT